jgi:hypothetical protein
LSLPRSLVLHVNGEIARLDDVDDKSLALCSMLYLMFVPANHPHELFTCQLSIHGVRLELKKHGTESLKVAFKQQHYSVSACPSYCYSICFFTNCFN